MARRRRLDIRNEKADALGELLKVEADEYRNDVDRNSEGRSAEYEKFVLDETTTPKVLHPNKND